VAIADDALGRRESLQQMSGNLRHEVVGVAENWESLFNQSAMIQSAVVFT
jgi:hypothetical protein